MLANNYSNLYQSDFYRKEVEFFQKNNDAQGLANFEQRFSLANVLYTESKKCIGFTSRDPETALMSVVGESELINAILGQDKSVFEILRDAEGVERTTRPNEILTSLAASITVCSEHLEKIQGMHR